MEKPKKLIFGDPTSIAWRDECLKNKLIEDLENKVKCPFCGAKVINCFEIDLEEKYIGWNFNCKSDCPNFEATVESEEPKVYTNLEGKFI